VFEENACGACHTFAAAGSNADFGPNLDESELSYTAVYTKTRDGGGEMLAYGDTLSPRELADVAQFVVDERDGG
jgi:mono/diheme cytochrome c family protein